MPITIMHSFYMRHFHLLIAAAFLGLAAVVSGDPPDRPAWWSDGDPPVIDPNAESNNHGMASVGQAKWMVSEALRALDSTAPSIATQIRADLAGTGPTDRIVDLAIPEPKTPEWIESQKAPLLLGQLKAMAKPFYIRLSAAAPNWLDHESAVAEEKGQLQINGTKDQGPAGTSNFLPWTVAGNDDNNKAPATIGQLKAVFSLRFEILWKALTDSDQDGMKDHDELYVYHTDPYSVDTDEDGVSDWDEVTVCSSNPLVNEDLDEDGIPDDMEKYLANQLLASNPDPAFWGIYYAGLVAGNLDPAHDYTGEGKTAADLARDLVSNRQAFKWDQPVTAQIQGRWVRSIVTDTPASGSTPRHISGVFQKSAIFGNSLWYSNTWIEDDPALLSPRYLDDHFEEAQYTDFRSFTPGILSTHTMTGSDGYGVLSSFDTTVNGSSTEYVGRDSRLEMRAIAKSPSHEPFSEDYYAVTMKDPDSYDGTGPVLDIEKFTLSIPKGKNSTAWKKFKAPMTLGQKTIIQIEKPFVNSLSPQVTNEDGEPVPSSAYPSDGKTLTPFVEVNPAVDKIAHRELLVSFGWSLKGKKVRWTQAEVPGAVPATIRGGRDQSPTHKNCFEASADFPGRCTFTTISQAEGETTVGDDGYAAIRVNVPPIGFNKVRIMVNVENTGPSKLIDMEVPGVVVIDPGHGGKETDPAVGGSSWNNATSPSGKYEKDMTLTYGFGLREALIKQREEEHLNLRVFMTRDDDHNVSGADRAKKAKDNGADIINVIHFNAFRSHRARGTLEVYRTTNNVYQEEDTVLSSDIIDRVVNPLSGEGANHRERVLYLDEHGNQNGPAVSSDLNNGNTQNYHPVRTAYIEVEFIDYGADTPNDAADDAVDILFNTGPNTAAVKTTIVNAIRDGIINNLRTYTTPSN